MFFNSIDSHEFINESYENRNNSYWTTIALTAALRRILDKYTFKDAVLNVDIWEDSSEHTTVIKITIDGNKILIERLLHPEFDITNLLEMLRLNEFMILNPRIIVEIV